MWRLKGDKSPLRIPVNGEAVRTEDIDSVFDSGGYCEEVTPVPIPNTVVKLFSADDTGFSRESRSLPGFAPLIGNSKWGFFLPMIYQLEYKAKPEAKSISLK